MFAVLRLIAILNMFVAVIVLALARVNETNLIQAEIRIKNFVLIVERAAL